MQPRHGGIMHQIRQGRLLLLAHGIPQRIDTGFRIEEDVVAISLHIGSQLLISTHSPAGHLPIGLVDLQIGERAQQNASPLFEPVDHRVGCRLE